jgi:hypothetical protein
MSNNMIDGTRAEEIFAKLEKGLGRSLTDDEMKISALSYAEAVGDCLKLSLERRCQNEQTKKGN